jgi:hypothetical protein
MYYRHYFRKARWLCNKMATIISVIFIMGATLGFIMILTIEVKAGVWCCFIST